MPISSHYPPAYGPAAVEPAFNKKKNLPPWKPGEEEPIPPGTFGVPAGNTCAAVEALTHGRTRSPEALGQFVFGPTYDLYRILQSAANACYGKPSLKEDWLTEEFVKRLELLEATAEQAGAEFTVLLKMYAVMKHKVPAIQEAQVGADLALIVAGESLLGHAGAKVFWVQAKQPTSTNFQVKVAQDNASCEFRQISSLIQLHSPASGSHALYLLHGQVEHEKGASALWTSEATGLVGEGGISASALNVPCRIVKKEVAGKKTQHCSVHENAGLTTSLPMTSVACRLQEFITKLVLQPAGGAFEDAQAFSDFLNARLGLNLVRRIIGIAPRGDQAAALLLDEMERTLVLGVDRVASQDPPDPPGSGASVKHRRRKGPGG